MLSAVFSRLTRGRLSRPVDIVPPGAPAPADEQLPLVDRRALDSIRSIQQPGRPDIVAEVLVIFEEDARERVQALRRAVDALDTDTMFRTAHALKSSCADLGAARLAELCRMVETLARRAETAGAEATLDAIEATFTATLDALRNECRTSSI